MTDELIERLGEPDIKLAGLLIWVHGRQYPDMNDYWDGNWLLVTICCVAGGSRVCVSGPIIHLTELYAWNLSAAEMQDTLAGESNLKCMEPELSVCLKVQSLGHIDMQVEITPDHLRQEHKYYFEIDQSYLSGLIQQSSDVLVKYPIRGHREN